METTNTKLTAEEIQNRIEILWADYYQNQSDKSKDQIREEIAAMFAASQPAPAGEMTAEPDGFITELNNVLAWKCLEDYQKSYKSFWSKDPKPVIPFWLSPHPKQGSKLDLESLRKQFDEILHSLSTEEIMAWIEEDKKGQESKE